MELKISSEYEELAMEWQYEMIVRLKKVLEKHGVVEDAAKEIVADYTFDFSVFLDDGELNEDLTPRRMKVEDKPYRPMICFDDLNGSLLSTGDEVELHEYAHSLAAEVYGE